jgi:hypothetical protein
VPFPPDAGTSGVSFVTETVHRVPAGPTTLVVVEPPHPTVRIATTSSDTAGTEKWVEGGTTRMISLLLGGGETAQPGNREPEGPIAMQMGRRQEFSTRVIARPRMDAYLLAPSPHWPQRWQQSASSA